MNPAMLGGAWIALALLAIAVDWIGSPLRGRFRPAGERVRGPAGRRALRRRWRQERDDHLRAVLAAQPPRRRFGRRPPHTAGPAAGPARHQDRAAVDAAEIAEVLDGLALARIPQDA